MRDLELWRWLEARDETALATEPVEGGVLEALAVLAAQSMSARRAFVGKIAALAAHAEPAVRAVAVRVLAGARGVPGVRAVVARLDDDDEAVRGAALEALRATAGDAPMRYAHALFHGRVEIRRAALAKVPRAATELAAYLRGDPACAELAAAGPWPSAPLPLAFDLHAQGQLSDLELLSAMARTPSAEVRAFCRAERGRAPDVIDAYLEQVLVRDRRWSAAPGGDVLDQIFGAIDAHAGTPVARSAREQVIEAVTPKKERDLTRRAAVSLMACFARRGAASPALIAICCALEPRTIELASFEPAQAGLAAAGLIEARWPVSPPAPQVERLLRLPLVRGDLALAAAVAGLFPAQRLKRLGELYGGGAIVEALVASNRGWDEICALPDETPSQELAWLAKLEPGHPKRYAELAGRSLAVHTGKRLERMIDQIPRKHRAAALLKLFEREDVAPGDARTSAVCQLASSRVDRAGFAQILEELLAGGERSIAFARLVARALPAASFASAASALHDAAVAQLVAAVDGDDPLPRAHELALAGAIAGRPDPVVREWAARMTRVVVAAPVVAPPVSRGKRALTSGERTTISTCADRDLDRALAPALGTSVTGLTAALALRKPSTSVAACAALLGCADPYADVAAQLDRFGAPAHELDNALDLEVMVWERQPALTPLLHARLYRWEAHNLALGRWIDETGSVLAALRAIDVPGAVAARTMWRGIAELVTFLRYRYQPSFLHHATHELAVYVAERVDRPYGRWAARILIAIVEAGAVPAAEVRALVLDRAGEADDETREYLRRITRLDGLPEPPPRIEHEAPGPELIEQVQQCTDLDELVAWCRHPRPAIVQEAVLALLLHDEPGQLRLAALLAELAELPAPVPLLASIALWESPAALDRARALAASGDLPAQWRFHLSLGLFTRGEAGELARAFEAARAPSRPPSWFRRGDWDKLVQLADPLACAIALADSPHHHAYQPALTRLLDADGPEVAAALRRFLEVDADRPLHLRRRAAARLALDFRDPAGLPILVEELADPGEKTSVPLIDRLLERLPIEPIERAVRALAGAALVGGDAACSESRLWTLVARLREDPRCDPAVLAELYTRMLEDGSTPSLRRSVATLAISADAQQSRLREVAEVFAWGVRRGLELTGRRLRVHMTSKERDLGHTFLDGDRIFVSPLPMLRREPHGRDVVEGLVLHELGHHVYHRGAENQAIWKQAHGEGLGHLLNLVADEQLERNLRALDREHGDRLKRLAAYGFQHAAQEIRVSVLLGCLRGSAARALIAAELEVAFDEQAVRVRRGAVLVELDRMGHPLGRFARALRMGLGNRHQDPLIGAALELCGSGLRKLDMRGLYDLTRRLAAMFGGSIAIAQVFGGPEGMTFGERDEDVHAGIDDEILQREVERILEPKKGSGRGGPRDRLAINVNPDEAFAPITRVVRVRGDRAEHARIATDVSRHATRLRAQLDELGLRYEPARARITGRALDRTRLRALVTRNDPRILVARTPVRRTDLFLATLVDCSGSMQAGQNIERARRFAVLIAEAVRPLAGVEARFFGFTDSLIYDAGDGGDCGVTGLVADGGNNDAAGLLHAANAAAASRKRAKVLVMISDGLPTECSVAAVRGLVSTLTRRRGMVCAQVVVRPLEEVMFPHYLVLDDDQLDTAVARFGRMIGDLARRALGG